MFCPTIWLWFSFLIQFNKRGVGFFVGKWRCQSSWDFRLKIFTNSNLLALGGTRCSSRGFKKKELLILWVFQLLKGKLQKPVMWFNYFAIRSLWEYFSNRFMWFQKLEKKFRANFFLLSISLSDGEKVAAKVETSDEIDD